jgi:uncharacterized membrane protein YfcA
MMEAVMILSYVLMLVAAFPADALSAVVGCGNFLTLWALVFTGVPSVSANAAGTVALLPGYITDAWGFREDIEFLPGISLRGGGLF